MASATDYLDQFKLCDVCKQPLDADLINAGVCSERCAQQSGDPDVMARFDEAMRLRIKVKKARTRASDHACTVCGEKLPARSGLSSGRRKLLDEGFCSRKCAYEGGLIATPPAEGAGLVDARSGGFMTFPEIRRIRRMTGPTWKASQTVAYTSIGEREQFSLFARELALLAEDAEEQVPTRSKQAAMLAAARAVCEHADHLAKIHAGTFVPNRSGFGLKGLAVGAMVAAVVAVIWAHSRGKV